jgi:hypothetical protein
MKNTLRLLEEKNCQQALFFPTNSENQILFALSHDHSANPEPTERR